MTLRSASKDSTSSAMRLDLLECVLLAVPIHVHCLTDSQESFNARLKAEGDDGSTNLYISNLPKSVTEAVSYQGKTPP